MYYLRTKSAVDAIKFTLSKETKKEPVLESYAELAQPDEVVPVKAEVQTKPQPQPAQVTAEGDALSPEELRDLIAQAKEGEGDDCLMCGS
jgi:ribonucleoside-diphosphate reductase alpha chain